MFENVEIMQRISMFAVVFAAAMLFFFLWGRREDRRTRAAELADIMKEWGMDLLAKLFHAYSIGNYIGKDSVGRCIREIYNELTGSGLPKMLRKVGWKIVEGVFINNDDDRDRLAELLARPRPKLTKPIAPPPVLTEVV